MTQKGVVTGGIFVCVEITKPLENVGKEEYHKAKVRSS